MDLIANGRVLLRLSISKMKRSITTPIPFVGP